jgi:DNA-binding beta-propeller fold protein YncE
VITNSGDDTLSFVDLASFEEVARIPVGMFPVETESPHHVAVSPDGKHLFVGLSNTLAAGAEAGGPHGAHGTGSADGFLLKIDARTGRQVGLERVDRSPGDVRLQPGSTRIWQSHYDLVTFATFVGMGGRAIDARSHVVITDAETMERVERVRICPTSHGIGFSPDGSEAYVSCGWTEEIAIIDTATFDVERHFVGPDPGNWPLLRYQPYALAVAPDGKVWVSNTGGCTSTTGCGAAGSGERGVRVFDPARRADVPELAIQLDATPLFGDFDAAGKRYFLVTQAPDRLLEIDPADATIVRTLELGPVGCLNAHTALLAPDESELWVVCEGDRLAVPGSLERIDVATFGHTGHVQLGLFPDDVALLPAEVR